MYSKRRFNVLITSASRKVNLVKAFKKALNREGGGNVIAVDIEPLSSALFFSNSSCIVPRSNQDSFIPTVLALCKRYKIKLIVPSRDEELVVFAKNKEVFDRVGTKVMVASHDVVENCLDKLKFLRFCENSNIPVPRAYSLAKLKSLRPGFPLFVRNRFGKAGQGAYKVSNPQQLKYILSQTKDPIIQEYLDAKEYTVDLFADFDGNVISVVPRERISVYGGESFKGRTCCNQAIIKSAIELSNKLKLIGQNTIQCFFDNGVTKFIEVNPRFGGAVNLSIAAGADTPRYLIRLLKGKKVSGKIGQFKDGLVMLRYARDLFILDGRPFNG